MRILFITLSSSKLNTSAMVRNNALITGLAKNGLKIDMLSIEVSKSSPSYDETIDWPSEVEIIEIEADKRIEQYLSYSKDNKSIMKSFFKKTARKVFHAFSHFDNTISHTKSINKKTLKKFFDTEYDVIISSSDPKSSHIMARMLIKNGIKYGKWIQYWGDPLTNDITRKNIYPVFISKYFERKILNGADIIIYVSPFTLEIQQRLFPKYKNRMFFLPIPYKEERKFEFQKKDGPFKLGYFGDYNSKSRNILPLYSAMSNKKNDDVLLIVGNSDIQLESNDYVKVLPRMRNAELHKKEEEVDVLICLLNKKGSQIPGKLYHYAATNKPILVILDGDCQDAMKLYLDSFNRFIVCSNNEANIEQTLTKIMKENTRFQPVSKLNPTIISKKVLDLLSE